MPWRHTVSGDTNTPSVQSLLNIYGIVPANYTSIGFLHYAVVVVELLDV